MSKIIDLTSVMEKIDDLLNDPEERVVVMVYSSHHSSHPHPDKRKFIPELKDPEVRKQLLDHYQGLETVEEVYIAPPDGLDADYVLVIYKKRNKQ